MYPVGPTCASVARPVSSSDPAATPTSSYHACTMGRGVDMAGVDMAGVDRGKRYERKPAGARLAANHRTQQTLSPQSPNKDRLQSPQRTEPRNSRQSHPTRDQTPPRFTCQGTPSPNHRSTACVAPRQQSTQKNQSKYPSDDPGLSSPAVSLADLRFRPVILQFRHTKAVSGSVVRPRHRRWATFGHRSQHST